MRPRARGWRQRGRPADSLGAHLRARRPDAVDVGRRAPVDDRNPARNPCAAAAVRGALWRSTASPASASEPASGIGRCRRRSSEAAEQRWAPAVRGSLRDAVHRDHGAGVLATGQRAVRRAASRRRGSRAARAPGHRGSRDRGAGGRDRRRRQRQRGRPRCRGRRRRPRSERRRARRGRARGARRRGGAPGGERIGRLVRAGASCARGSDLGAGARTARRLPGGVAHGGRQRCASQRVRAPRGASRRDGRRPRADARACRARDRAPPGRERPRRGARRPARRRRAARSPAALRRGGARRPPALRDRRPERRRGSARGRARLGGVGWPGGHDHRGVAHVSLRRNRRRRR